MFSSCARKVDHDSVLKSRPGDKNIIPLRNDDSLLTFKTGRVKRGEGLFQSLKAIAIDHENSLKIINALRDKVEFSKLKVGDQLSATYDHEMHLVAFSFANSPAEKHVLKFDKISQQWHYSFLQEETLWATKVLTGKLRKDSTLQFDLIAKGLKRSVVAEVINVLLCKVNFRLDARRGDDYKILLNERIYQGKVIASQILYTSYSGRRAGTSEAYYYHDGSNKSTYTAHYTEDGEALIRSGLRYPVNRLHIRSGYGRRRHPVTGKISMHRGVDLRARSGAPVYAVARGVVIQSNYNKYSGNKIAIRHADRSVSYYLHLKNRAVKTGQRIKSHQIIGRVGATGRVTGPHLHFGFKRPNGRWMNPMSKRMIATPKLKGERLNKLEAQVKITKGILYDLEFEREGRYVLALNQLRRNKDIKVIDFINL